MLRDVQTMLMTVTCRSPDPSAEVKPFDDLRQTVLQRAGRSLAGMNLRDKGDVLQTVTFDTRTEWPARELMPSTFDPARLLETGADPGLGIRSLHATGITGKGVNVALIDQPLLLGHKEYAGKVAKYTPIDCWLVGPQMHGAAVASLLVGKSCGVAPGASLFFWAEPSWKNNYDQRTKALKQIMTFNEGKPAEARIRVVSVSIGFVENLANLAKWKDALSDAERSGLVVVHCADQIAGIRCPMGADRDNPASYKRCHYLEGTPRSLPGGLIYVPIDNRTTAGYEGEADYVFWAESGLSWAPPYLAGVIALGIEVNPSLSVDQIWRFLRETGDPFEGGWIVNPRAFVDRAAKGK